MLQSDNFCNHLILIRSYENWFKKFVHEIQEYSSLTHLNLIMSNQKRRRYWVLFIFFASRHRYSWRSPWISFRLVSKLKIFFGYKCIDPKQIFWRFCFLTGMRKVCWIVLQIISINRLFNIFLNLINSWSNFTKLITIRL